MSEAELQPGERREHVPAEEPRIYVASLSDYNAGRLHGRWLDAHLSTDELQAGVEAMLSASPTDPRAEEWAIHDYQGFYGLRLGEWESLERVSRLGKGIVEHGEAFAAWVANDQVATEELDRFEDCYLGRWDSVEDYAEQLLDDLGVDLGAALGPEWLQPYVRVDVAAFARDLSSELSIVHGSQGVYVFEP